jgi:HTH-type transcriptional regulator/antitoxin HigA
VADIRPIRTEADYQAALATMASLWGAPEGSPESEQLEVLGALVGLYEDQYVPIEPPDPVEALKFHIDQGRLSQSDLARIIGSRARASEILARRRRLTLEMVWRIHTATKIPLSSLVRPYKLAHPAEAGDTKATRAVST